MDVRQGVSEDTYKKQASNLAGTETDRSLPPRRAELQCVRADSSPLRCQLILKAYAKIWRRGTVKIQFANTEMALYR